MFNHLTKYLLQYKRVSIPAVGTFHLVQQPAQLNIADKMILPPSPAVELKSEEEVPEHQLNFLAASLEKEKEIVRQSLQDFGIWLKEKLAAGGFDWKGIGVIHQSNEAISLPAKMLEAVPAEKVIRHGEEHDVLVGDQHLTSTQIVSLREEATVSKRPVALIIGWCLLALSILYILFILWKGKLRIGTTGSKSAPTVFIQNAKPASLKTFYL